jgi:hypothetical protein
MSRSCTREYTRISSWNDGVDVRFRYGGEAVEDLPKIISYTIFQKHIEVSPFLENVLRAPVTEVVLTYFPSNISVSEKSAITKILQNTISSGLRDCADAKAVSYGWGVETNFPVLDGEENQTGAMLALFVGWANADARDTFWASWDYKKDIEDMMRVKEVVKSVTRLMECRRFGENHTHVVLCPKEDE